MGGALNIDSILVGRDQRIEIVLVGSLKQQTELEKLMGKIGSMLFDEVMNALVSRLS